MTTRKKVDMGQLRRKMLRGSVGRIVGFVLGLSCLLWSLGIAQGTAVAESVVVEVREVVVNRSEILTEEEIRAVVDAIIGQSVTWDQLQEVVDRINSLYAEKQFITAKAILPPQVIDQGVVRIELVEGRLGDVTVENNMATRDVYFIRRVSLRPGDLVRLDVLEWDLMYFNATNDVQMRAELKAGKEFGLTDLALVAAEPARTQVVAFADNGGREETGLYRVGVNAVNNSLFGNRDAVNVGVTYAEGTIGTSLSYDLPVGRRGGRFGVSYDYARAKIIAGAFETVGIDGLSVDTGVRFSHPLVVKPQSKISGSLEWKKKNTDNFFSGVKLQTTQLQTATFSVSGQWLQNGQSWSGKQNVILGRVQIPKESDFVKYLGTLTWQRALLKSLVLTMQGQLQWTNGRMLPFSEQLSLGGMSAARGYPAGTRIGDRGFLLSAELSYPVTSRIQGMAFLDYGGVFPYKGNDEPINAEDYLVSCGLGATVKVSERVFVNAVVGWPVGAVAGDAQIHFTVQTRVW